MTAWGCAGGEIASGPPRVPLGPPSGPTRAPIILLNSRNEIDRNTPRTARERPANGPRINCDWGIIIVVGIIMELELFID